jgi:hypothetical protein
MLATMKPGYAFELESALPWDSAPDDDWDTVIPLSREIEGSRPLGSRLIDGSPCIVFSCPDGKHRAQLASYVAV